MSVDPSDENNYRCLRSLKKTTHAYFSGFFVSFEVNFPFSEIQQSLFFPSPAIKYGESQIETSSMANSLRINPYNVRNDILSVQTGGISSPATVSSI